MKKKIKKHKTRTSKFGNYKVIIEENDHCQNVVVDFFFPPILIITYTAKINQ